MPTVSTVRLTVNLSDGDFVDQITKRWLYRATPYAIALQVMDGNAIAEADLTVSMIIKSAAGDVVTIAGTNTDASGESTITIADDDITFDGDYTAVMVVNSSRAAEFPLEIKAIGTPVPSAGTVIDWNDYTSYTNTATNGPVRPGTGITNVVNADGSNTHSVTYGSTASTAAEGNDARLSDARTPTAHASTHATGGSDPVTAADVDVAGTAIAAALGLKADDNAVVKLTGDQTVAGEKTFTGAQIMGLNVLRARSVSHDTTGALAQTFGPTGTSSFSASAIPSTDNTPSLGTSSLKWLSAFISTVNTGILKALATTGLVVQNSAGTEKLKVGASTGADVQVTGDFSVTEKQATAYQNTDTRVATLAGNETLTTTSAICQFLNPDGADRSITMPSTGLFSIRNTGSAGYRLNVYESDGTTLINFVENDEMLTFISTSADTWQVLDGGTGASSAQEALTALTDRNKETLAGTKALTSASSPYQFLDPDAVDRDVTLPTTGIFVIKNNGSTENILTVKNSLGTTVDTVEKDVTLSFLSTATDVWEVLG
jgi:hypothetical protein